MIAGNAAGEGAARALLSEVFLRQTEQVGTEAAHIELAQQEAFQQEFLASMEIVPWN